MASSAAASASSTLLFDLPAAFRAARAAPSSSRLSFLCRASSASSVCSGGVTGAGAAAGGNGGGSACCTCAGVDAVEGIAHPSPSREGKLKKSARVGACGAGPSSTSCCFPFFLPILLAFLKRPELYGSDLLD